MHEYGDLDDVQHVIRDLRHRLADERKTRLDERLMLAVLIEIIERVPVEALPPDAVMITANTRRHLERTERGLR